MQKIKKHHYGFISRQNGTGQVKCDIKKKCYHSDPFQQDLELRIPKKSQKNAKKKKIIKIKKHHCGFISSQNRMGQVESDTKKKKVIVPIHSNPIRTREFPKNSKKCKNLGNIIMASFQAKTIWDKLRMIQKKCYRSDPFQLDPE